MTALASFHPVLAYTLRIVRDSSIIGLLTLFWIALILLALCSVDFLSSLL